MIANGFAHLATSFTDLLLPRYQGVVSRIAFPILLGEMAFMPWLPIMGARPRPVVAAAS